MSRKKTGLFFDSYLCGKVLHCMIILHSCGMNGPAIAKPVKNAYYDYVYPCLAETSEIE